ncbi:helix-turn-helix domain-containing protein [Paenarthrobacter nitroguajacolicus]
MNIRTARDWDQGIRKSSNRRIYPDGRVVEYNQGVSILPAVTNLVPKSIDARFLSLTEREMIRDMAAGGSSMRTIAQILGRSPSTISRELARNTDSRLGYLPHGAHRQAACRRARPKTAKLVSESELRDYVKDKLLIRWSPEQISNTLIEEFPHNPGDAREPRNDLSSPLPPGQRRTQTRSAVSAAQRTDTPQTTHDRRTTHATVRGPYGHDFRASTRNRRPRRPGPLGGRPHHRNQ